MTTPSLTQETGLSLSVFRPKIDASTDPVGYIPDGEYVGKFAEQINSWEHTVKAFGGYDSAKFTIDDRQDKLEEWFDDGLGRHVVCHNPSLEVIWEGFVNKVSVNLGGLSAVRGLLDVANYVVLVYMTVDATENPPIVGVKARTTPIFDTPSLFRYGLIQKVLSSGGATPADAAQIAATYLAERREPVTSQRLIPGGGRQSVTIECLGYVHWLKAYVYNQTTNTLTYNLSTKIIDVLNAELNTIYNGNYDIVANTLPVDRYENDDKEAWGLIKSLVAMGDASSNRYLFGVYADRRVVYERVPDDVAYQQRLADPSQRVETLTGGDVEPWDVLPGKWLFLPDFLIGQTQPIDRRLDPRFIFIESTTYRAPWGLSITGGKVDELPQLLARMGLAGVGG